MKNTIIALFATCCLLGVSPRRVLAAPPTSSREAPARVVHLEVDISTLGEHAHELDRVVRERLEPKLVEAGFEVSADAPIVLRVRFRPLESGRSRDYGVHFEFVEDGTVDTAIDWVDCHFCADARLFPLLDAQLPALLEALEQRAKAGAQEVNDGGSEVVEGEDVEPSPTTAPIAPIGAVGGVGIGVAALGIGAVVWGAVELSRGRTYDQDPDNLDFYRTGVDHTPRGKVLLGAGIGGVVVGGALLITDLVIRSKRRKQQSTTEATSVVVPFVSQDTIGLGWTGRF